MSRIKLRTIRTITVALTLFIIMGCAATIQRPIVKITHPPAGEYGETLKVTALNISAKIKADKGPGARAVINVRAPDLIRVEVYGAMRRLVMIVTGDKARCEFFKGGVVKDCKWEDARIDSELGYLPNPKFLVPFLLNTKGTNPLSIEVGSGDGINLRLSTNEYLDVGGEFEVPLNVGIESPGGRLVIDYREVEVNPTIDDAIFILPIKATP